MQLLAPGQKPKTDFQNMAYFSKEQLRWITWTLGRGTPDSDHLFSSLQHVLRQLILHCISNSTLLDWCSVAKIMSGTGKNCCVILSKRGGHTTMAKRVSCQRKRFIHKLGVDDIYLMTGNGGTMSLTLQRDLVSSQVYFQFLSAMSF